MLQYYYSSQSRLVLLICVSLRDGRDDGDGLTNDDETLVYGTDPGNADSDGDSLSDGQETFFGTDPSGACGTDKWPVDTNNDQMVNVFDVAPYIPVLNAVGPGPPYVARLDLNTDAKISVFDLVPFIQTLNTTCSP